MRVELSPSVAVTCYTPRQIQQLRYALDKIKDLRHTHPKIVELFKEVINPEYPLRFTALETCFYYLKNYTDSHQYLPSVHEHLHQLYRTTGIAILKDQITDFKIKIDGYIEEDNTNNKLRQEKQELAKKLKIELKKINNSLHARSFTTEKYKLTLMNYYHLIVHAMHETVKLNMKYKEIESSWIGEESGLLYEILKAKKHQSRILLENIFFEFQDAAVSSNRVRAICHQVRLTHSTSSDNADVLGQISAVNSSITEYFHATNDGFFFNESMSEINKKLLKTVLYLSLDLQDSFAETKTLDMQHEKMIRLIVILDYCLFVIDENISEINNKFIWLVVECLIMVSALLLEFPHFIHLVKEAHLHHIPDVLSAGFKSGLETKHYIHQGKEIQSHFPVFHGRTFKIIEDYLFLLLNEKNGLNATITPTVVPAPAPKFEKAPQPQSNMKAAVKFFDVPIVEQVSSTTAGNNFLPKNINNQLLFLIMALVAGAGIFSLMYLNFDKLGLEEKANPCLCN